MRVATWLMLIVATGVAHAQGGASLQPAQTVSDSAAQRLEVYLTSRLYVTGGFMGDTIWDCDADMSTWQHFYAATFRMLSVEPERNDTVVVGAVVVSVAFQLRDTVRQGMRTDTLHWRLIRDERTHHWILCGNSMEHPWAGFMSYDQIQHARLVVRPRGASFQSIRSSAESLATAYRRDTAWH